jgi:tetratricopeptide (TPR) repeat protein
MLPPSIMMTITKRGRAVRGLIVIAAACTLLTACGPPGRKEAEEGRQMIRNGQFAEALGPLKEAAQILAAAPGPSQAKVWNLLGLAYHDAKQLDAASAAYGRALKLDRNNVAADYNLGCLRLEQGNLQGSIDYLNTYVMLRPHDPDGFLLLGTAQFHLALERSGAARSTLLESARRNFEIAGRFDGSPQSHNALGMVEFYGKNVSADTIKTASGYFQLAVNRDPRYSPALLNLAIVQQRYLNQPREAMQTYRRYLALGPNMPHAKEIESIVHQLDLQTRITITPEVRTHPPASPAQNAMPPTNPPPAHPKPPVVEPASTKPPEVVAPPAAPKQTLAATAPPPASTPTPPEKPPVKPPATPAETAPPETVPQTASAPTNSVPELEVPAPQPAPARKTFGQKINPLHWFAGSGKANETTGEGQSGAEPPPVAKGARYNYPLRVTLIPGQRSEAVKWVDQATQARQQGMFQEALHDYQQAIQADPTYYEANEALGLAALDGRDYAVALDSLNRALELRTDSANARYAFAWALQKCGYYEDAAKELEQMLAAHPDEVRGHLLLGKMYAEKLNQPKLAREHYVKALELDPQGPQAATLRLWMGQNH